MDNNKKNDDFVQVYRRFIKNISDLSIQNSTALTVLLFLIKHMDGTNALSVSSQVLADTLGVSRQTISKSVNYLRSNGWLEIFKNGSANVYVVNPEVVWTSYADQKAYCKMQGSLLLSADENWEIFKNPKATNHYKTVDTEFVKAYEERKASRNAEMLKGQLEFDDTDMNMREVI